MRQGAQGLMHWDDPERGMGREVGGGFRMGNTCTPMVDSCQCMAKPIPKKKKNLSDYPKLEIFILIINIISCTTSNISTDQKSEII